MKNFEMKLEIINNFIQEMFAHKVQILDPDDRNYRLSGIFYNSEQDKTYFSIKMAEEEEEE